MTAGPAIPSGYLDTLARIESGRRPYIKAATSSASGLYQFIRSTWEAYGGRWGDDPNLAFGGLSPSVEEQTQRATAFTLDNARRLVSAGIEVNAASLYAAHFLGFGTARKVLMAAECEECIRKPLVDIVGGRVVLANPFLRGKTVGDFMAWLRRKVA